MNWSQKLRADHRLLVAIEKLLQQLGPKGAHVSVQSVAKVAPLIGIVVSAGINSATFGAVAEDARRYCQTRFLCEKYGLPQPAVLVHDTEEADDDGPDLPSTDADESTSSH